MLKVASGGKLILQGVTVQGGNTTDGGGIHNSGTLIVKDSTITGNTASNGGGGIYNNGGTVTVESSTISNNSANGVGGGGIYSEGGTVSLKNSTVANNSAPGNVGGGLYVVGAAAAATVTIDSSTVSSNTANIGGCGIAASNNGAAGLNVTLNNSTVSGNSNAAGDLVCLAGGIFALSDGTNVTLNNVTVSNNTVPTQGGGIYAANSAVITLNSSIVSGNNGNNSGNEVSNVDGGAGIGTVNADNNNVFGHSGEANIQAYTGFTPGATDFNATFDSSGTPLANIIGNLSSNGGPTQTHALPSGSPAIDLGGATCPNNAFADQRGYTRPINFKCDAGAYEYSAAYVANCGNGHDMPASPASCANNPSTGCIWQMTGAPSCAPAAPAEIGTEYSELGAYGNWVASKWNSNTQKYNDPSMTTNSPLVVGDGNWIVSLNAATLGVNNGAAATAVEACSTYDASLSGNCYVRNLTPTAGSIWQLVGHPFPYTVDWANVRVADSSDGGLTWTVYTPTGAQDATIMSKTWWRWNNSGSSYDSYDDSGTPGMTGTLRPQESFWVRILSNSVGHTVKLLIPARSVL